ncbi:branched chain amino acid/phenylalanine ABC transporter ATP binding subunit LivF [Desulfovibrionales bacterium]
MSAITTTSRLAISPVEPILELRNVSASYGRIQILKSISLKIFPGEIVSIIGANGAGKSTTLMTICAIVRASAGEILYKGEFITGANPAHLPSRGLCQVPEGRRIFPRLTVTENFDLGAFFRSDTDAIASDMEMVFSLFPILSERRHQYGGTLSGGEQQMLAIGRALMARPRVLLLDEPSLGLSPLFSQHIFQIIATVNRDNGTTIVLVEQNAHIALSLAHRGYVMEMGQVIMEDSAQALLTNSDVCKAYLGE